MIDGSAAIMELKISAVVVTHPGSHQENEDSYLALYGDKAPCGTLGLFAVSDGMGGAGNGVVASSMAVQTLADVFPAACQVNQKNHLVDVPELLRYGMQKANAAIYRAASEDQNLQGVGAACLAASIAHGVLYIAHVGDSRAYLFRAGQLRRLTEDEWVRKGTTTVVNQAVGLQPLLFPKSADTPLLPEDIILLSTDGLTEAIEEKRIEILLAECSNVNSTCELLLEEAISTRNADNVTLIVLGITCDQS